MPGAICPVYMPGIWVLRMALTNVAAVNTVPRPLPQVDPAWWGHPLLRPRLAAQDIQALYRWLQRHGWSQAQIGAATGQTQPEVSAILHGRKVQAYEVLVRVSAGLEIPPGYLGLSGCIACAGTVQAAEQGGEGEDPMFRRQFLGAVAAVAAGGTADGLRRLLPDLVPSVAEVPTRVGATEVAQVREVVTQLRALDRRFGGGAALDAARGFAGWAHSMLGAQQTEEVARELRIALTDLQVLIAWAYHDACRPSAARRHHLQALALAREVEDPTLTGTVLGDLARVSAEYGDPTEGIRLSRLALLATDSAATCPAVRAELHVGEALALARLADGGGARQSLSRAGDDLAGVAPDAVPAWASSATDLVSSGCYSGFCGRVYGELARSTEDRTYAETAVEHAERSLAVSEENRNWRGVVLVRVSLATGQLRAGARDEGLRTAHEAVAQAGALRSVRARTRLTDVAEAAGAYAGHPDADDLRSLVAALTPA